MRTSNVIVSIGLLGLAFGLSPSAVSFDGTRTPEGATVSVPLPGAGSNSAAGSNHLGSATPLAAVPVAPSVAPLTMPQRSVMPLTPLEAFRSGTQLLRQGKTDQAVMELDYAAEQGVPGAIWKLGRMYADGDGVKMHKGRAYEYFSRLTSTHADDAAGTPNARFLANAFVTLGLYHLEGIPGTLKADPNVAREMFRYAASYFADPEAQYYLGRLYLIGKGAPKDAITAARWLRLSADKGDHRAQALLGGMLFKGEQVSRQAARGLFWLIIAKDSAGSDEGWITDMYSSALAQANENERALAHKYLEDWLKNRRE
jgi:TPR repeat protein